MYYCEYAKPYKEAPCNNSNITLLPCFGTLEAWAAMEHSPGICREVMWTGEKEEPCGKRFKKKGCQSLLTHLRIFPWINFFGVGVFISVQFKFIVPKKTCSQVHINSTRYGHKKKIDTG